MTPIADPAAPASATTVTGEELRALPVAGRRWQDFTLDTPSAASQGGGEGRTSLGGAPGQMASLTVDGGSKDLDFGGATEPGQPWAGGRGLAIREEAIRSVQTEAGNVQAQNSRSAGGRIAVETDRGGNGLHGQGFVFERGNLWGAQNPFTQWVKETSPATSTTLPVFAGTAYTPPDRETSWGLGLGGRIRRDKLFWFAAVDSYARNDPGVASVRHPDLFFAQPTNDRMQMLSDRLLLSRADPVSEGLEAHYGMLQTLDGLLGPAARQAGQWVGFGRLDWQASERNRFTVEGIGALWNAPGGGLTRVSEAYGNRSFGSSAASEEWILARWETYLTPDLRVSTQGTWGRDLLRMPAETPSPYERTLLGVNAWGQLPQIAVDSRFGFTIGNPTSFGSGDYPDERLLQGQQSIAWAHGGLLVAAGIEASGHSDAVSLLRDRTGSYSYASVENFASDALAFAAFGLSGTPGNPQMHNCDQTGKVWRDSSGALRGLGSLPCYSYYTQTLGPTDWNLTSTAWAGFATAQWQPRKMLVISAGMRWERQQLAPPFAALRNVQLPATGKTPDTGNQWGPRVGIALGNAEGRWPVLRLGYGMYFGATRNAVLESAMTQTGSLKGDLNLFMRPTDNLAAGGAPPFPYVLAGPPGSVVKPAAVQFAPAFRNPEIHQAIVAVEESLPGRVKLTASAAISLGRHLPFSVDTNLATPTPLQTVTYNVCDEEATGSNSATCSNSGLGPIKAAQIALPFYASWPSNAGQCPYYSPSGPALPGRLCPDYQQIVEIESKANSTYESATLKVERQARKGLSLHAHYTYSHAMDWNPNESAQVAASDPFDPADFRQEYGTGNLDVRHAAAAMAVWEAPWKLRSPIGRAANGWSLAGVGQFRSGLPYTMRTAGSLAEEFNATTGAAIVGLGPGMNGSGGDNRVFGVGRNTYRYPAVWKVDLRIGRRFNLGRMRQLELLAESFNLFNRRNVTEVETTGYSIESGSPNGGLPTLNFLTGLKANATAFGQPLNVNATNSYRERQIQFGLRIRF